MIQLGVILEFLLIEPDGHLLDDIRLQVDNLFDQGEHTLRYDVQDVTDVRHQLGGVVLRDGEQVGASGLIDAHQRQIQSRGEFQKGGPQSSD